jgi:hypothetical protein
MAQFNLFSVLAADYITNLKVKTCPASIVCCSILQLTTKIQTKRKHYTTGIITTDDISEDETVLTK